MADRIEVTLDDAKTIELLRSKVRSGEFASEEEAVRQIFAGWQEEQAEIARWEQEVIVPAHDRLMADPSSAIPIEEVMRRLEEARNKRLKAS